MAAVLNSNPLINVNSENVSEIVLAHNKNISSIFNKSKRAPWNSPCDNTGDSLMNDLEDGNETDSEDAFTAQEVFDLIRSINDPEHPLTLEQLNVVLLENVKMNEKKKNKILINFTPTIPHCSMATLIGLSIRVKLLRSLPPRFKVRIEITPGTHQSEKEINKQLNDKERVAAALENYSLIKVVNQCIRTSLQ